MVDIATGWPLSDEEYEVVDEYLAGFEHGESMTLEELDGFFCALVAGPEATVNHKVPSTFPPRALRECLRMTKEFGRLA